MTNRRIDRIVRHVAATRPFPGVTSRYIALHGVATNYSSRVAFSPEETKAAVAKLEAQVKAKAEARAKAEAAAAVRQAARDKEWAEWEAKKDSAWDEAKTEARAA